MWVQSLGLEGPLEKEMATHSSIVAWRIPRTEEPGGLQRVTKESDMTEWLNDNELWSKAQETALAASSASCFRYFPAEL